MAEAEVQRGAGSWLLLIHQVPAKPDYLRVKVWRRLQRIGAANLKNSVWVLPATDAALEDCHWLLKEIAADGGDGLLCEASFLAGLTTAQEAALARFSGLDAGALKPREPGSRESGTSSAAYRRRVWVTRPGVHVDRIASAWLIRRWIDPEARFRFASEGYVPSGDELRFDMFEGEFTHRGDRCTFEVLAGDFLPGDVAVARLGQMVHDVDFKDGKYGLPETAGFARVIGGICARLSPDAQRIERGAALLDDLYAAFAAEAG